MSSGAFSSLIEKVSFANQWPVLLKATSDDDQPTPGYLYQEINQLTLKSGSYCQDLLDCLTERVKNTSYHVKIKALRILKFVVENGHPEFRHGLRKKSKVIVEATKFGGPPDPIHGNSPYVMVRNEATELSQMLFEVEETDGEVPCAVPVKMASTGGIGSGSSAGAMQGFGNTPLRSNEKLLDSLKDLADKVLEPSAQPAFSTSVISMGEYHPVPDCTESASNPQKVNSSKETRSVRPKVKGHTPGKAGGGWEEDEEEELKPPLIHRVQSTTPVEDWSSERRIVNELVSNKECRAVNCDKVIEFINKALDSEITSVLMRAMLGVESLLSTDLIHPEYLTEVCVSHLMAIYQEQNGQCKQKARKILRILQKFSKNGDKFDGLPAVRQMETHEEQRGSLSESTQSFPFARTLSESAEISLLNAPFVSHSEMSQNETLSSQI
ncbi:hypothetical protein CAPTEDRAFT_201129 [Capitella teleta]|uniref:ENTH domain-containing protein n=1 Tax=Capitella teleta TaxID=283909 RepID=R7VHF6_CAPTE|nr:hypothetical protein CAPTEDRAFT_201129 [Capitella teleta]|eukprot:ELU15711.1 hypothetical protein CAPTEDRAFT_201129 [Capitella teleta]